MMSWLTAEEALARMGTKPQTLYANVSRGRITARPDPDDPRKSLYRQDDVERLAGRQQGRRPAHRVAAETIAWGEPVLETRIATVSDGRLLYRGQDAVTLAESATLGAVARLLWNAGAEVDFAGRVRALTPGMAAAYRAVAELAATDMPSAGRMRRGSCPFLRGLLRRRERTRCMSAWRGNGSGRMRPTRSGGRWCSLPSTNSMPRPLPRG
jgi:citrate synthase